MLVVAYPTVVLHAQQSTTRRYQHRPARGARGILEVYITLLGSGSRGTVSTLNL